MQNLKTWMVIALCMQLYFLQTSAQAIFTQSNAFLYVGNSSGTPQTPETATPTLYIDGNAVNNGTLVNDGEVQFRGNFANNGAFTASGDEVMNGSGGQTLSGNYTGANGFNYLLVDKPSQVIVDANSDVEIKPSGLFKFVSGGIMRMNGMSELRVLNGATAAIQGYDVPNAFGTYSNDRYVIGRLGRAFAVSGISRDFPIGDHFAIGEGYNPVVMTVNTLSAPDVLVGRFQKGSPGTINTGGPMSLLCATPPTANYSAFTGEGYWEINQKGTALVDYGVMMHSNTGNTNSAPTADYYRVLRHSSVGGAWPLSAVTDGDECTVTTNYYQVPGSGYSGFSYFAVAPSMTTANVWLGGGTSNWHTPTNWSTGVVPTCATTISIPSGNTPYPVISSPASCGNITVGNGVTITTIADLQVCGNWVAGTTPAVVSGSGGFVIFQGTAPQSFTGQTEFDRVRLNNPSGFTLQPGSWFDVFTQIDLQAGNFNVASGTMRLLSTASNHCAIINDFSLGYTGTLNGNIKAQRYISGTGNVQHQMGLPVAANLGQIGAGTISGYVVPTANCDETQLAPGSPYGNVFRWDEHNPTTCILQGWNVMNSTISNESGRGYSTYQIGGSIIEVTGLPNLSATYTKSGLGNSSYNLPTLQSSPSYSFNSGWHLLANPYPSGYTYTAQTGFGAVGSVYVPSGPFSGTYQPLNHGDVLAPFQGFMLYKTPGGTATYTLSNPNRVASGSQFFYQSSYSHNLEIEVSGNNFRDKTSLRLDDAATDQFDPEYDLRKQRSNLGQPSIFTGNHVLPYRIDTRPFTSTVPLGLTPGSSGQFTFDFSGIQSFDPTTYIYLEDKVTNHWENLRSVNSYTFSMQKYDDVNRFVLHFTPPAIISATNATCEDLGQITIQQPGPANWQYTITTTSSNTLVGSGNLNENSPVTLHLPEAVYQLTLEDANGYKVVKNIQVNGAQPISAQFTSSKQTAEVGEMLSFNSTNSSASQLTWDMGDGTLYNNGSHSIQHQYTQEGAYDVSLHVANSDGCSDTKTQTVVITAKAITSLPSSTITGVYAKVYPNPNANQLLFIELSGLERAELRIVNALGEGIVMAILKKGLNKLPLTDVATGVYMVEISDNKWSVTERLVVVH